MTNPKNQKIVSVLIFSGAIAVVTTNLFYPRGILRNICVDRVEVFGMADSIVTRSEKTSQIETLALNYAHGSLSYHAEDLPITNVRAELLKWYGSFRRKLPWRGDTSIDNIDEERSIMDETIEMKNMRKKRVSAYGTWVSEIMCQQTRVETVISYWRRWMEVNCLIALVDHLLYYILILKWNRCILMCSPLQLHRQMM